MFTASLAAIKALMSASGIPELSGTVRLWEKEPGIYFLHGGTTIYIGASRATVESYDSILILSDFFQGYNYKYYIIYNTIGQITYGQARETGGTSIFSNITPFQGASELYQGGIGTVPAPQAGDNEKFLKGDGTWGEPDVFDGATSSAAGQKGAVPAPQAGDNEKFLKGDGTWGNTFVWINSQGTLTSQGWEYRLNKTMSEIIFIHDGRIPMYVSIVKSGERHVIYNSKKSANVIEFYGFEYSGGMAFMNRLYCSNPGESEEIWKLQTISI